MKDEAITLEEEEGLGRISYISWVLVWVHMFVNIEGRGVVRRLHCRLWLKLRFLALPHPRQRRRAQGVGHYLGLRLDLIILRNQEVHRKSLTRARGCPRRRRVARQSVADAVLAETFAIFAARFHACVLLYSSGLPLWRDIS